MNYDEWLASVPAEIAGDALWNMQVYRLALFVGDLAWQDIAKLVQDKRTLRHSSQLYSAVGSIAANIAEGYSHKSRKIRPGFTNMLSVPLEKPESGIIKAGISLPTKWYNTARNS